MSEAVLPRRLDVGAMARAALKASAALWFCVAAAGQFLFAFYIAAFYGGNAIERDWQAWNDRLINGFIEGDAAGNIALVLHIALAFLITAVGVLQFVPAIRARAPVVHRWLGRIYISTAFVISVGAIYMVNARDSGAFNAIAIQINAVLILTFATLTLRNALARKFVSHHRWALRTFLAVSGVWFLRVGYGLLVMIYQGPIPGVSEDLSGPTDIALAWASFLAPLAVLQLYFWATESNLTWPKLAMSGALAVCAVATGAGIVGAAMIFWIPNLS